VAPGKRPVCRLFRFFHAQLLHRGSALPENPHDSEEDGIENHDSHEDAEKNPAVFHDFFQRHNAGRMVAQLAKYRQASVITAWKSSLPHS
jgi:hypothetical protein